MFLGVSAGVVPEEMIATMAPDGIVFALSNPDPEIHPHVAAKYAAVVATGRSDFRNQINNVLAFPGVFRGALDAGARRITEKMMVAAAEAIFSVVSDDLAPDRIVPSPLDLRVGESGRQGGGPGHRSLRLRGVRIGRLAGRCSPPYWLSPAARRTPATALPVRELVVGSGPDAESTLLAGIYVAALRSYGFGARAETAVDPMAQLDSGAFTVVPGLHRPGVADACSPARWHCPTPRSTARWCPRCPRASPRATTRPPLRTNPCCW